MMETSGSSNGFIGWLRHPQRGLPYLICSILIILVLLPFLIHYYLSSVILDEQAQITSVHGYRLDRTNRFGSTKTSELKIQIDELRNIRLSVSNELLDLEKKRQAALNEISSYNAEIEGLKHSYQTTSEELNRLKISLANLQVEQRELLKNNLPNIEAPMQILPVSQHFVNASADAAFLQDHNLCDMHSCFDYSRCSVTSQFPVFVYPFKDSQLFHGTNSIIKDALRYTFDLSPYVTSNPQSACLFVVVLSDTLGTVPEIERALHQLPYWYDSGLNHLLLSFASTNQLQYVNIGAAMVAQSHFSKSQFRPVFDILIPASLGSSHGDVWEQLPMLIPARRKYLLTFVGEHVFEKITVSESFGSQQRMGNHLGSSRRTISYDDVIVDVLKKLQTKFPSDSFHFEFFCGNERVISTVTEWTPCATEAHRAELLLQSTFSLIIAPADTTLISSYVLQIWLFELLKSGAVPVILGDYIRLPFDEIIDWSPAVIKFPKARVTELHFILRSFADMDILEMRRRGRIIFETYFATIQTMVDSVFAITRRRLQIPAYPVQDEPSPSVFNQTFLPLYETVMESVLEADEMLGPIEPPLASVRYYRNFTFENDGYNIVPGKHFFSFPYTPFEPVMPADAKFVGSSYGFRPIGQGAGGTGKEFSEALGGNIGREQFTVVILTYEREAVLINAISRLKGLPYVNKVVVVWNSPRPPAEDLRWPDIGVKIHVIKTAKNSLNNRFLPYDAIETEAVLSVDDDAHLRHDEIMFGFRIWREARDRIVGFPGRFNSWDIKHENWLYNSNYSCELSMVLTGAAFIHKYYLYVYSVIMPHAIRDKVDEYLNCEDLAMNFLVSHITRKPPIKVTSRWTFRCPGCPKALSVEESHFNERHQCMNFFVRVYGYLPLLNTQFRADSVLFKTRISHDKQKCFKFI